MSNLALQQLNAILQMFSESVTSCLTEPVQKFLINFESEGIQNLSEYLERTCHLVACVFGIEYCLEICKFQSMFNTDNQNKMLALSGYLLHF